MATRLDPELLARLERLDLAVGRIHGGAIGGRRESTSRGSGTEFLEHRSYTPGDDPRRVDWNVYARLEELHVKEFTAEERLHLVLAVDTSPSMDYGRHNKLARARELAACLGFVALRRLDRVSLVGTGDEGVRPAPYQGPARTVPFVEHALSVPAGRAPVSTEGLTRYLGSLETRPDVVLLSDLFGRAARRALLAKLAPLARRATCLHLVDPEEESPALGGRIRLADAETGRATVLVVDKPMLAAYRERFERHVESVRADCRASRVAYVRLSTSEPPERATLSTLRRSGVLR